MNIRITHLLAMTDKQGRQMEDLRRWNEPSHVRAARYEASGNVMAASLARDGFGDDEIAAMGKTARCAAARQLADLTSCDGPHDAVHVHDHPIGGTGATVDGCELHAARLLASLEGTGRVHPGSAGEGSALRVYKAAQTLRHGGEPR